MTGPILRGTALGSALGILPGNGAVLAASPPTRSRNAFPTGPRSFGKGALAGVAGPESPTMQGRRRRSSRC